MSWTIPPPLPTSITNIVRPEATAGALIAVRDAALDLVCCLSGSIVSVPQLQAKVAIGLHLRILLEHSCELDARARELGRGPFSRPGFDTRLAAILAAEGDAVCVLAACYKTLLDELEQRVSAIRDTLDPLLDRSTSRLLNRFLVEIDEITSWWASASAALTPHERTRADAFLQSLAPAGVPAIAPPRRATTIGRDLPTFQGIRDYRNAPGFVETGDAYLDARMELCWINRDEIDAIETFAIAIFDLLPNAPFELLAVLGQLCEDEARHVLIGCALLDAAGVNVLELPCGTVGIELRNAMSGWDAFAQISIYGEASIIGPMRRLAEEAHCRSDQYTAAAFEYIAADEAGHLRIARRWIAKAHPAGSLAAAAEITQRRMIKGLSELGSFAEEDFAELLQERLITLHGE